jgi:hypothetical protein
MKATLTIETPQCCFACPCFVCVGGVEYCNASGGKRIAGEIAYEARSVWCPITPIYEEGMK